MLKHIVKKSLFILIPVLIASFFIEPAKLPLGIFLGWFFGIINFKGMIRSIEGLTEVHKAKLKLLLLSVFRLAVLFAVIVALAYYKIVNIIGLLVGFTIVFIFILIEGMEAGRSQK